MKDNWVRTLLEQGELEVEDRRLLEERMKREASRLHEQIEGLWAEVVAELESAIKSYNQIGPPDMRVTFSQEQFDFTAKKETASSPHNILCVRLDIPTKQILSFQRSNSYYEIKTSDDELQLLRPDGSRIDPTSLAEELLSELFLTP